MINVETALMLANAMFWTTLYSIGRTRRESMISISGIISFVSWWIVGFLWLFLAAEPVPQGSGVKYGTYSISLLFFAIGLMILILQIIDLMNIGKARKELGEVEY